MVFMPNIEELRESFKRVHNSSDPLQQEYDLVRESELFNMPLDIYRRLYELSLEEPIPTYPKFTFDKWRDVPSYWYRWLMDLPVQTRYTLAYKILQEAIKQGVFISLLVGIIQYIVTCGTRQKQAHDQQRQVHYQAWQIIRSASDKSVSGGRIEALQDLAKDKISLAMLSAPNAYLQKVNLEGAELREANFSMSNLGHANLSQTVLIKANLSNAKFFQANLSRANLFRSNLSNANLFQANLSNVNLFEANLSNASLFQANLSNANLSKANLDGVNLIETNLSGAKLHKANLDRNILSGTNLQEADLSEASLRGTQLCGTVADGLDKNNKVINKWKCANFRKAKNLQVEQVKAAIYWEQAHYSSDFRQKLNLPLE